jgi:hypothetical protein
MSANLTGSRRRPLAHHRTRASAERRSGDQAATGTEQRQPLNLERGVQLATAIVAPTTVLTALLFYYGWVRTNALFQYFGVDATVLGFTTQDYLLRSSEALYVPVGTLLVVGLVGLWVHGMMTSWLAAGWLPRLRATAVVLGIVGLALFARGVAGVAVPRLSLDDLLVTPVCLGLGAVLGAYGRWLWLRQRALQDDHGNATSPRWHGVVNLLLVAMLVVLSLFWATSDYARAYGRGRAVAYARQLAVRPGVVVYSADRLFLHGPGVREEALPAEQHTSYRYRYSGLRLLTESRGRLFLLPQGWIRTDGAAIVLAGSDKVRVEFTRGLGA